MKTLHKTLTALLLAVGTVSLAGAAQAGDRVTVIYSSGSHHRPPALVWTNRPPVFAHRYHDRHYAHGHAPYYKLRWRHEDRYYHRHEQRRFDDHRSHQRRDHDRRDDRGHGSGYGKGDRH